MLIGDNLKKFRIEKKMTLAEVSEKTGISAAVLCNTENGTSLPSFDHIIRLLIFFKIKFSDLAKGDL